MKREIVVVGAGPSGLIVAREIAKGGVDVLVLEEHEDIGIPCHCAGLISVKGLMKIGVPSNPSFLQNKINGAVFHSPSDLSFTVKRKETVAYVVNRPVFDNFLAQQAIQSGAEIMLRSKVKKIMKRNNQIVISLPTAQINASAVVYAGGVYSNLVKELGLKPLNYERVLPALQYDLTEVNMDSEFVEIYLGSKIAPNFFAWVIPLSDNSARVGLACKAANPRKKLENFIKKRFGEPKRIEMRSGRVVTCGPISKTFGDNLIIVGDAAGHVKSTTGGGIVLGGICASIAGKVLVEAVKMGSVTSSFLSKYERLWKKILWREFKIMLLMREFANRLSDKTIDKIFKIVLENNLQKEISKKGDIDLQTSLLLAFTNKIGILKIIHTAIPDIIRFKLK